MNTFEELINKLSEKNAGLAEYFKNEANVFHPITQPIDSGARELLEGYSFGNLSYSPLEVEYLIQTLNEHIANCLDIRIKAQELEVRAFMEINEQLLTRLLLESLDKQSLIIAEAEPLLLGNTIKAKIQDGEVEGDLTSTYWTDILAEQQKQIQERKNDSNNRINKMKEPGSGLNYVSRFNRLKDLFNIDLREAYCRARSASIGLRYVYGIDNIPLPELTDVGYLDELTLWARKVTYELEKKFFKQRFSNIVFALHNNGSGTSKVLDHTTYQRQRDRLKIEFDLRQDHFVEHTAEPVFNLKNPRLRGLDICFITTDHQPTQPPTNNLRLFRVKIVLPSERIPYGSIMEGYAYSPVVYSPATSINYMSNYPTREIEFLREIHNVNPIGRWSISFNEYSINGSSVKSDENAHNIYLRMRVAYERE